MAEAEPAAAPRRLFFALWPDAATAAAVVRAAREAVARSGGEAVAKDRLHMTVAFLGELTAAQVERARSAPPIRVGTFELVLDTLGLWPRSRTLWLAGSAVPEPLEALEAGLWDALEERGFRREERVYRPHVTLARRARAADVVVQPVAWRVAELVLAESLPAGRGVHYEVLDRWPV